jgi:hypothetical protein
MQSKERPAFTRLCLVLLKSSSCSSRIPNFQSQANFTDPSPSLHVMQYPLTQAKECSTNVRSLLHERVQIQQEKVVTEERFQINNMTDIMYG